MNVIEEIFKKAENGTLTYDEFTKFAEGMKFADISKGDYVSKSKFENEVSSKESQIATLNETISKRDADLADLQKKLADAGNDADKLSKLNADFTSLQAKYDADVKEYQSKISKQSYEFAVNNIANEKKFTSGAAKRDFVHSLIDGNLEMKDGKIVGVEDFINQYATDNADAFVVENPDPTPTPADNAGKPQFAGPTSGNEPIDENKSQFGFHFNPVR